MISDFQTFLISLLCIKKIMHFLKNILVKTLYRGRNTINEHQYPVVSLTVYCHCISHCLLPLYLSLSTAVVSLTVYRHCISHCLPPFIFHYLSPLYLSLSTAVVSLTFCRRCISHFLPPLIFNV